MAEKAPWENDGLRYTAGLQDATDVCCYKDFFESEKLDEAKRECEEAAARSQRSAIVYDRKLMEIVYRKVIEREKKVEEKKALPPRRGRRKTESKIERKIETTEKKKITKDDYFD
jgi:hypothetical protein